VDSTAVNKLIRSEIWPIIKNQGFSVFEKRTAFRYYGPFINVVNFQSFNSHLAEGITCTTFSFALNLGTYVLGSEREHLVKRSSSGQLLPREYECSFRAHLKKRTLVDGFTREDIFYIDADGRTAAACFQEVRYLLSVDAPEWFADHNNLDGLLARRESSPERRSFAGHDLFAMLRLLKHEQSPTHESAMKAFGEIEGALGTVLDFPQFGQSAPSVERQSARLLSLCERLGTFAPVRVEHDPPQTTSYIAGTRLWPLLKQSGFTEFTDNLAHRITAVSVETVEVVRIPKNGALPDGLFHVGLGIYWPGIRDFGACRKNKVVAPRPKITECHLTNWLLPKQPVCKEIRSAFDWPETAAECFLSDGSKWFDSFADAATLLKLLQQDDWPIFWRFPMLPGFGAKASPRRLIYLAYLSLRLCRDEQAREQLHQAESGIDQWYHEHMRPRYREWVDRLWEEV
jgi:hypothetical protein